MPAAELEKGEVLVGDVARARIWVGLLIVTLLTLAFLGLAPTGEGTYFCDVPPVARLFQPEAEAAPAGFPDEGAPSANQPEADVHVA